MKSGETNVTDRIGRTLKTGDIVDADFAGFLFSDCGEE